MRTTVLLRETYDSASTPKVGETRVEPKELAAVDLERLRAKMAATIEKAKADDPKELRRTIAEQSAQIRKLTALPSGVKLNSVLDAGKPVLTDADRALLQKVAQHFANQAERAAAIIADAEERLAAAVHTSAARYRETIRTVAIDDVKEVETILGRVGLKAVLEKLDRVPSSAERPPLARPVPQVSANPRPIRQVTGSGDNGHAPLSGPEQRILDALAWLESVGNAEPELAAVAFLAGYTVDGGAFNNPRGKLRGRGLIEYLPGGRLQLTDDGRRHAAAPDVALTTDELHRRVLERLPGPEQRLLSPLLAAYPQPLSNEQLAEQANYTAGAGAFNNPRGRLRSLGLVEYPRPGFVVAKSLLFLE
jgi:hypothetical protein